MTASRLSPVATLSRREGVMASLRRAIVLGDLLPGQKLTETALAADLEVSRPTVREAIAPLIAEGLLVQEPYRGVRVSRMDAEDILELAESRQALDMVAADRILADTSGTRMQAVRAVWAAFEQLERHPDPLRRHEAHLAFHRGIWEASGSTLLGKFWPTVEAHLTITAAHEQQLRDDPERAHHKHAQLVEALASGDRARIAAAFHDHTVTSAHELVELIRTRHQGEPT